MSIKLKFNSKEFRQCILDGSRHFADGIWLYYNKTDIDLDLIHPCKYDFLSFYEIDNDYKDYHIEKYLFSVEDISNGIYSNHPLDNLTLEEILDVVGEEGWSYELK